MIPKIIHYCWFGGKKKPKLVRDCILSWRKELQGYEFIEWNEKNADFSHPFIKEAYRKKKWAFVADYVRFKALFEMGGIYLDTDMMLLKPLDIFLNDICFFGAEEKNIVSAGIIGSEKSNLFIKNCLLSYDSLEYKNEINWNEHIITKIITNHLQREFGFRSIKSKSKKIDDIVIYPPHVFYPFPFSEKNDLSNYNKYIVEESFAVHLWVGSWVIYNEFWLLSQGKYFEGIHVIFKQFSFDKFRLKYLRDVGAAIKQSLKK